MDVSTHLSGLDEALTAFLWYAGDAGLDAAVPTAPGWDVRRLIAHQGMVHRWSAGVVRGERVADATTLEAEGLSALDPLAWLRAGVDDLQGALRGAPEDLDVLVFLKDAPAPRAFWARRQCHETTMHAIDALAASLGRRPRAEETWVSRDLALDGIDELLTGFMPRGKMALRASAPLTIAVRPDDADAAWTLRVSQDPVVTTRVDTAAADVVVEGPAVALFLRLWNRSDEPSPDGFDLWDDLATVSW